MRAFAMTRFTIVAPTVTNAGTPSGYPAALRAALLRHGIDGWMETDTRGAWRGKVEPGVTFEILRSSDSQVFAYVLARIARAAFGGEQEAIQVTADADAAPTRVVEG